MKKKAEMFLSLATGSVILLSSSLLFAQEVQPPVMPPPPDMTNPEWRVLPTPAVKKVSPGVFSIGDITINKEKKSVSFPAQINMDKGLLEYLLVRTGGKTHESLLRTNVEPYHLQIALLLLGFEGTEKPVGMQGAPEKPGG
ncbi:MAG: hypothetical protein HGA78_10725, partial [Nitrospirales bacterium]|nr:hypothetical protein [Nitrospirales bacterium]